MKEQKKRFMHKLSLNKRLALVTLLILIPMITLVGYLLYLLNDTNQAFGNVTESITYANNYSTEFRERMDYSMYLAVIRGEPVSMLEEGRVTVNGVKIVNPYSYIEELDQAFDIMEEIATVSSNKNLATRMQRTLNSLSRKVKEIDENMDKSVNYDENLAILRGDIYGLTEIIEGGIQDYISAENAHFSIIRDEMVEQCRTAFQICFLIVVAVSFFAWMLSMMASRSVTRPIRQLCDMAKLLAKGDLIMWLAEAKQTEDVVSMVTWLSDFFRTTLSKGQDYITVEEEKNHIDSYLKIQHFRYQDILEYEIDIEEEIYDYMIPKLTLQPLVENALYHGIKLKRGMGKILIQGFQKGERLIFRVIDNGKGMDEKTLNELRKRIAGLESASDGGFGLSNVNQRLQYYFGEEYGVLLESEENVGTEATIIMGAKKNITLS